MESRHGAARLVARTGVQVPPGQVFCAFHFPQSGVNSLTSDHTDTATSCPEYKVTAVRVNPLGSTARPHRSAHGAPTRP
ncbi:molybdopterin dinucleotide binding domain-containing protein [Actinacidiphila bryophytorum]|uniref:molybdopterin dinucleotide binding domain-containing protein n=1 Tax=Actinacidiphila bryophytorum TaxID=1436133 RepID=UPI00203C5C21|nr:molybdopterin dinucleotide binding domain-containing protein [Actinacidiphila bryophytorum]